MKFILLLAAALSCKAEVYTVTAYCHCAKCCGEAGLPTASGKMPKVGWTVASTRRLPFGTVLLIEGVGQRVVEDRLPGRGTGKRLDIFTTDHQSAARFGVRRLAVTVVGKPNKQ